jgi:SAM-dependent methyltransferase
MKRMHLIEISDEEWCPRSIRHAVTDFTRFVTEMSGAYHPVAPLLADALRRTGARRVLDLGSGAAGPWLGLLPKLRDRGTDVAVCLTDLNPNVEAFERARRLSGEAVTFHPKPVDATQVPAELPGFRTIFSAFHHLRPAQARALLADAVAKGEGVGVFECANRSLLTLAAGAVTTPLRVLLTAPFIRPFRWSRLFWTYLVPVLPFILAFDVVVSCLRIYSVPELRELTTGLDGYHWDAGTVRGKPIPIPVTYLIGVPAATVAPGG